LPPSGIAAAVAAASSIATSNLAHDFPPFTMVRTWIVSPETSGTRRDPALPVGDR
jgi:hypothetical protein